MASQGDSLPFEILQNIFLLAQSRDFDSLEHAQIIRNARIALIVSHVCQHWRAAALGLSALWVFVSDTHHGSWIEYTSRSNPLPLVLSVTHITPNYLPEVAPRVHHVVQQVFDMEGNISAIMNCASLPNLRTFSLSGGSHLVFDSSTPDIRVPQNCFLALKDVHLDAVVLPPTLKFTCLEKISMNNLFIPTIRSLLAPSASTLTHITIGGAYVSTWHAPPIPVVLPVCKTLTLINTPFTVAPWLCTPALVVLHVQVWTLPSVHSISNDFASWQQSPLTTLVDFIAQVGDENYIGAYFLDWSIPKVFGAIPNVRRVRLDVPSRNMVSRFASFLNQSVWTALEDIAIRVKGEDANELLLGGMQKANANEVVKPY